jgi:hypothetical protein
VRLMAEAHRPRPEDSTPDRLSRSAAKEQS